MLNTDFSSALFDGGWRAADHDQLMQEYGFTADEAAAICEDLAEIEKWDS